jgi:molecular chaperone GrpE
MRPDEESQGPVIRDRRRIDPATGQVRDTGQAGPQRGPAPAGGQPKPGKHSVSKPGATGASADQGRPVAGATSGQQADAATADGAPSGGAAGTAGARDAAGGATDAAAAQVAVMLSERTADLQRLQAEYANYRKRVERDRLAVREQALANVLHELLPVLDDIGRAREHGELTGGFKSVAESLEGIVIKLGLTSFGESGDPFDPTLHEALMHSYSADVTEPTAVQILQPGYKVGERIIRPARVAVAEPEGGGADADAGPSDISGAADSGAATDDGVSGE